ncbi:hypothetical protein [Pelosinus propionicus]|uniref:Uncharacterized protein n=1 Tax=Pelosinus propionicus DSM 13327 TaxID=1123291 RepID=A0A1I4J655_9FIRM|nr:hypothetical protein [Pelosinus propionicus]SFL62034.1 hypothetical protein SAMN04490355_101126 [Pelosinus propionicus DSM 13327]
MSTSLAKRKIMNLTKDSFYRDIITLMVVSIVIGSLLATSISTAANSYFSKTLASLVGDYGEYDILIQSREEMKEDTATHIQKIIEEVFPGARMKEGPTITGKTSFFIAIPEENKTKQTYEELGKIFGGIPGGAGVGVLTEPRLTIRGVPEGARTMMMDVITQIDGVRFAFRDGSSIGVVLSSLDKSTMVTEEIKKVLKQYQVIEISFPVGSEPQNPIRMGESIGDAMKNQLKLEYAKNVSIDGKNDDMTYMVSTMMELKRFLAAYASQVTITPNGSTKLVKGDTIAFAGIGTALAPGNPVDKGNVIVQITAVHTDGKGEGTITQGDAALLTNNQGYRASNGVISDYVGTAAYQNPRQQLGTALTETTKIVDQIPGFAQDSQNLNKIATLTLDNYSNSIAAMEQTLTSLKTAGTTIQTATSGLANIDTRSVQDQIDSSSRSMGGLINTLQVLKLVDSSVGGTVDNLVASQKNLSTLKSGLAALDNVAADARQAKGSIDNIVANGNNTIGTLRAFDVEGTKKNMNSINTRLNQLGQLDTPLVSKQLQYLAVSVPNLKDEEITRSVSVLDKFIAGQAIPGERIQILTTSNISTDAVAPVVYSQVGHKNVSLYSTDLGIIEPNARGELYSVLNEVRAVLSGMTAIIVTILFLALDHTAIMTVIRCSRINKRQPARGWRGLLRSFTAIFTSAERIYGMVIGAILLTGIFILGKSGIPYLPWAAVPLVGALIGLIVACYTEKISPISGDEMMAGQSLGLSIDEIMREIVIPSGRPGLLQKLNQRKMKFK